MLCDLPKISQPKTKHWIGYLQGEMEDRSGSLKDGYLQGGMEDRSGSLKDEYQPTFL